MYFEIIARPIDLSTIEESLQRRQYSCVEEFAADILLMFENCRTYNDPIAQAYTAANRLQTYFLRRMDRVFRDWDAAAAVAMSQKLATPLAAPAAAASSSRQHRGKGRATSKSAKPRGSGRAAKGARPQRGAAPSQRSKPRATQQAVVAPAMQLPVLVPPLPFQQPVQQQMTLPVVSGASQPNGSTIPINRLSVTLPSTVAAAPTSASLQQVTPPRFASTAPAVTSPQQQAAAMPAARTAGFLAAMPTPTQPAWWPPVASAAASPAAAVPPTAVSAPATGPMAAKPVFPVAAMNVAPVPANGPMAVKPVFSIAPVNVAPAPLVPPLNWRAPGSAAAPASLVPHPGWGAPGSSAALAAPIAAATGATVAQRVAPTAAPITAITGTTITSVAARPPPAFVPPPMAAVPSAAAPQLAPAAMRPAGWPAMYPMTVPGAASMSSNNSTPTASYLLSPPPFLAPQPGAP